MIRCPSQFTDPMFTLAKKFNELLENVITGDKRSHILKLYIEHSSNYFDRWGNLTALGQNQFWKLLDATVKDFDNGEMELKKKTGIFLLKPHETSGRIKIGTGGQSHIHNTDGSTHLYRTDVTNQGICNPLVSCLVNCCVHL